MFKALFLLSTLALSGIASAEWKHLTMSTAEGVEIKLDFDQQEQREYNCAKCSVITAARPLWIHVKHATLKPSDKVRVVFMNYITYPLSSNESIRTEELDLRYTEEGTFSNVVYDVPMKRDGTGGTQVFRQQIAVVINGQWLKKYDGSSSNLDFKLFWK